MPTRRRFTAIRRRKIPACRSASPSTDTARLEVSPRRPGLRAALEDPTLPKHVHDLKAVLRALAPHSVDAARRRDDVMLKATSSTRPTPRTRCPTSPPAPPTARSSISPPRTIPPTPSACPKPPPPSSASPPRFATQIAEAGSFEHKILKDDPLLGGAMTKPRCSCCARHTEHLGCILSPAHLQDHGPAARPRPPAHGTGRRPHRLRVLSAMSNRLAVEMDTLAERIYTDPATASTSTRPSNSATSSSTRCCCPSR